MGSPSLFRVAKTRWEIDNQDFNDAKSRDGLEVAAATWAFETAPVASAAVCQTVNSSVTFFLLFCPTSRGASRPAGRVGPAPAAALAREPKKSRSVG
jgi:hypothetical protein